MKVVSQMQKVGAAIRAKCYSLADTHLRVLEASPASRYHIDVKELRAVINKKLNIFIPPDPTAVRRAYDQVVKGIPDPAFLGMAPATPAQLEKMFNALRREFGFRLDKLEQNLADLTDLYWKDKEARDDRR